MDETDADRSPGILLVLYASETGNAQDVAERIAREARAHLAALRRRPDQRPGLSFSAALAAPLDAIPLSAWPRASALALVVSTTGQGEPPTNMRLTWRRLRRRSLPPDALKDVRYALFGMGDSGYVDFCAAALRLDRRLAALGASALCPRALGDDRAPGGGHEAALDPWLARELWPALGWDGDGGAEAAEAATRASALPPPRFRVSVLPPAAATAASAAAATADDLSPEEREHAEAAAAAAAFRAMTAAAEARAAAAALAGDGGGGGGNTAAAAPSTTAAAPHGPWRPLMARLVANRRLTSPDHFQDTRHLEFDLTGYDDCGGGGGAPALAAAANSDGGGAAATSKPPSIYAPGDVLAIFPRQPRQDVDAVLRACGLSGDERLRISEQEEEQSDTADGGGGGGTAAAPPPWMEATARAVVSGVLDVSSAPPRRHAWEVLAVYAREVADAAASTAAPAGAAGAELLSRQRADRLALFASAAGREDAARYAWGAERRALAEVLRDFFLDAPLPPSSSSSSPAAAPPPPPPRLSLARLLESCPRLRPRLFSLASSPSAHGRHAAHVLAAVVAWRSPTRRPVRGLATGWLASLVGEAAAAGATAGAAGAAGAAPPPALPRVPVWIERAETLRPPEDPSVPLLLIGPGTGVAPFRAILQERAATAAATAAAVGGAAAPSLAPCHLFFGCRSAEADFYYRDEWDELVEAGVLARDRGLVTAFSRPEGGGGGGDVAGEGAAAASSSSSSRRYVTHRLREHADLVWDLVERRGAHVLVSGSAARMPADVADALADVAANRLPGAADGGGGAAGAAADRRAAGRAWVKALEARGRFRVEAWS